MSRNERRAQMWDAAAAVATVGLVALVVLGFAPFAAAADGGAVAKARRGPLRVEAALGHGKLLSGQAQTTHVMIKVQADADRRRREPVNLALVIDRSGSMGGQKMHDAIAAAGALLGQLRDGDVVSVVSFDDGHEVLQAPIEVRGDNLAAARAAIARLSARGGTDMVSGLKDGYAQAALHAGEQRSSRVILISDGQPNSESGLEALVRGARDHRVTTTTVGIGQDYNERLMTELAQVGAGRYHYVASSSTLGAVLAGELDRLAGVVARATAVRLFPMQGVAVRRVFGYASSHKAGVTTVDLGDLAAGQTVTLLAELAVEAGATRGAGPVALCDVETRLTSVAGKALATRSRLSAGLTQDRKEVVASVNRQVAERAVTVVAQADLDRAMERWQKGDRAGAEKIIEERQAALSKDARAMPGAAPAAAAQARVLGGALDEVRKAEQSGRSDAKQDAIKRRRADAYEAQL